MNSFGDRLREAREAAGLSQNALQKRAGIVAGGYISRLESGKLKEAGSGHAARLAEVLGVSSSWLQFGEGDRTAVDNPASVPARLEGGPSTSRPVVSQVVNEEHEHLLEKAFVPGKHSFLAVAAVRELLKTKQFLLDESADQVAMVREWLDGAVTLQRRGEPVTPAAINRLLTLKIVQRDRPAIEALNADLRKQLLDEHGLEPATAETLHPLLARARERAIKEEAEQAERIREAATPKPPSSKKKKT